MNDSEVRSALAEAESHFTHYEWDEAIRCFDAVLASAPRHAAASQGRNDAVQQKRVDAELAEIIAGARVDLDAGRSGEALAALNHAQALAALRHILKYHSEIDGLRMQAQESLEWQRRIDDALARARALARDGEMDAALQTLDDTWHALTLRGCEELGEELRRERERLWAERDLDERIRHAAAAFDRQDYRLALELAEALHQAAPRHQELRRLYERSRQVWARLQEQLAAAQAALDANRLDDAIALLAKIRSASPQNPDWQALWLRAHIDHGRELVEAGRAAFRERRLADAEPHFAAAGCDFEAALAVFDQHPSAARELDEVVALGAMAALAEQAARDAEAGRLEQARHGWEAAREKLSVAMAVRRRDFPEVAAVVDASLREAAAAVDDIESARALLAEGNRALAGHDAGGARQHFRDGLARVRAGSNGTGAELATALSAALAEAERVQRSARRLMARAERAADDESRLSLLAQAYEAWSTAPGLAGELADRLLDSARRALERGDEAQAAERCERALGIDGASPEALEAAAALREQIGERRQVQAALHEARRLLAVLAADPVPAPSGYRQVIAVLTRVRALAGEEPEALASLVELLARAEQGHAAVSAAGPHLARSEELAAGGEWEAAATALAEAVRALGDLASPQLTTRLREWQGQAARLAGALAQAREAFVAAEAAYQQAAVGGDLDAMPWDDLRASLEKAQIILSGSTTGEHPLPNAWAGLRESVASLASRAGLLQETHALVQAGRGVDALPALAAAAGGGDQVLAAVLRALQGWLAGDARAAAAGRVEAARSRLAEGQVELATDLLDEARLYGDASAATGGEFEHDLRLVERQTEWVKRIRERTEAARALESGGERQDALSAYREALGLAGGAESGVPAEVRAQLLRLLDLEERLWDQALLDEGGRLRAALDDTAAELPLLRALLSLPLRGWWRLAGSHALEAFVTARLALADYAGAYTAARQAVERQPGDERALELYALVQDRVRADSLSAMRSGLDRATRLEREGGYLQARAEIERLQTDIIPPTRALLPDRDRDEEAAVLLNELAALDLRLAELQGLSERIGPAHAKVRDAVQAGNVEEALAAIEHANLIDPAHRAAPIWTELDALYGLLAARRARLACERLETALDDAETVLELGLPAEGVRRAIELLAGVQPLLRMLPAGEEEGGALRLRFSEVKSRTVSAWRALGNGSVRMGEPPRQFEEDRSPERLPPEDMVAGLLSGATETPGGSHIDLAGEPPERERLGRPDQDEVRSKPRRGFVPAPEPPPPEPLPLEVGPFDMDDWLRNVTPVAEEDDALR